ncbi:AlpA family transcriptional regulator [Polynucleobacter sp. UK-Kesae-W10]|uniref:helix-turn-helix transcriptional regulator n=1 Tax=Polynucleobacter sp. UK-Kesae-W10 TaxID=1819738 RepID=UPI001C0D00F1|nr:AlpA family phage regulatory protein [Polynucleobacter sp. UK-Kesae-W10]MBU3577486.1 AlpA family phage regulatory protein [Polynucleobacter sp. UK-Kesae-W10]
MKLIRLPEVLDRVALKKTAIYRMMAEGDFPLPVKLGAASAWVEVEINDWIKEKIAQKQSR